MKKLILALVLIVTVSTVLLGAEAQTRPHWRTGEILRGGEPGQDPNQLVTMQLDNIKPVIASSASVPGTWTIVLPTTYSFVKITDAHAATGTCNALSIAAASEGMVLYIFNGDASPTSGIATISSNKMGVLFYASATWNLLSDE